MAKYVSRAKNFPVAGVPVVVWLLKILQAFVAVAQLKTCASIFILSAKISVSLCVLVPPVVKKGTPQRHQGTKNFAENVVQQPPLPVNGVQEDQACGRTISRAKNFQFHLAGLWICCLGSLLSFLTG
ncbi:MAG: hypothetical protein MI921_05470 [Cytophagales bacterium]|nr:hypothetical protein [Cytophagales bacterium]